MLFLYCKEWGFDMTKLKSDKSKKVSIEKNGKIKTLSNNKIDKKSDKVIGKKRGRPKKEEGEMSIVSEKRIKSHGDKNKK